MVLQVSTPALEPRLSRLYEQLATSLGDSVAADRQEELFDALRGAMVATWDEDLGFFNFIESEKIIATLASMVAGAAVREVSADEVGARAVDMIREASASITLRGAAREEYLSTRDFSRV